MVSVTYRNVGRTQIRNKNRYLSEVKGALFLIVFYIVCKKKKEFLKKLSIMCPPPLPGSAASDAMNLLFLPFT